MRMMVANVTLGARRVNGKIDTSSIAVRQILSERPSKRYPPLLRKLMGKRDHKLARHPRILAVLRAFSGIPQR